VRLRRALPDQLALSRIGALAKLPQATLQQQFKTTNYIGLLMMAAVFLYALVVVAIDQGYIPFKPQPVIDPATVTMLKYIFLGLALGHYFLIRYFQKFSQRAPNYLPPGAIIIYALCEAVALYGLVLFLLSGNATNFFVFMVISLLYFYLFYPKYADWERLWRQGFSQKKSAP
jgi:F0F1-type ATP synthase membrane subunit c/vacuolar-type H+-ATPase subunit K